MSVWIAFWLVLASALLFFVGWTILILIRQKSSWKVYAAKKKLRYKSGAFMASPEVEGVIGEHTVSIFSSEHMAEDMRGSRKLTAIEISMNSVMPITGGVASAGMIPILKLLQLKQQFSPDHPKWNKAYVAAANNRYVLEAYLTQDRIEALCKLMELKNVWFILVFKDESMLLRIDTPDPLDTAAELDRLIKQMLEAVKILELKSGESKTLKSKEVSSVSGNLELDVNDKDLESVSFELETEPEPEEGEVAEDTKEAQEPDVKSSDDDGESEKP